MTMSGKINDGDTAPTVELSTTMHTLLKNEFFEDITEFFEVYTAAKQHELGVPSRQLSRPRRRRAMPM